MRGRDVMDDRVQSRLSNGRHKGMLLYARSSPEESRGEEDRGRDLRYVIDRMRIGKREGWRE